MRTTTSIVPPCKKCVREPAAERGEVTALRENRFDFVGQEVRVTRNYLVKHGRRIEKAPKTARPAACPRPSDMAKVCHRRLSAVPAGGWHPQRC
jgi:hypothetical protein